MERPGMLLPWRYLLLNEITVLLVCLLTCLFAFFVCLVGCCLSCTNNELPFLSFSIHYHAALLFLPAKFLPKNIIKLYHVQYKYTKQYVINTFTSPKRANIRNMSQRVKHWRLAGLVFCAQVQGLLRQCWVLFQQQNYKGCGLKLRFFWNKIRPF